MAVSADGSRAVSGGGDGTVRSWDLGVGRPLSEPLTSHDGPVWAAAISADGSRAVSGGDDGMVRSWDLSVGRPLAEPPTRHDGPVSAVAISADGSRAVSGGDDGTVRLWDVGSCRLVDMVETDGAVRSIAISEVSPNPPLVSANGVGITAWTLSEG